MRSSTVALRTARTMALMALIMTWTWYTDLILPSSESPSLNYAESVCKTQITTMRAKSNYCKSIPRCLASTSIVQFEVIFKQCWIYILRALWEHSPPLLTFEAWLFQCKQIKAIGTKDHALMRQDALSTSRAVVEAVKASAWTKWLSEYILYIIYKNIYIYIIQYIMYDLNDLVQNLSTSRFTFLRTLWSNQWHLSTVSWVQKVLLVIRIALRGLTIGWGQPLFIFALKWLHQYTASLKMPAWSDCTMLHQSCTVQLSIIKSWLCFVFDVRCSI